MASPPTYDSTPIEPGAGFNPLIAALRRASTAPAQASGYKTVSTPWATNTPEKKYVPRVTPSLGTLGVTTPVTTPVVPKPIVIPKPLVIPKMSDTGGGAYAGGGATLTDAEGWAKMVQDYTDAKTQAGVGTGEDSDPRFFATGAGNNWVTTRNNTIDNLNDTNLLVKSMADFEAQSKIPGMEAIGNSGYQRSLARLQALANNVVI